MLHFFQVIGVYTVKVPVHWLN